MKHKVVLHYTFTECCTRRLLTQGLNSYFSHQLVSRCDVFSLLLYLHMLVLQVSWVTQMESWTFRSDAQCSFGSENAVLTSSDTSSVSFLLQKHSWKGISRVVSRVNGSWGWRTSREPRLLGTLTCHRFRVIPGVLVCRVFLLLLPLLDLQVLRRGRLWRCHSRLADLTDTERND